VLNFALAEPCKECGMSMKCICLKKQTHHEQPSIELEWNGLKDIGWMEEEMDYSSLDTFAGVVKFHMDMGVSRKIAIKFARQTMEANKGG